VTGELNTARATGTASRHVAAETLEMEPVAANSTHARTAISARKKALNSTRPVGIAIASRRRDIGTARVSARNVADGQNPRRKLLNTTRQR